MEFFLKSPTYTSSEGTKKNLAKPPQFAALFVLFASLAGGVFSVFLAKFTVSFRDEVTIYKNPKKSTGTKKQFLLCGPSNETKTTNVFFPTKFVQTGKPCNIFWPTYTTIRPAQRPSKTFDMASSYPK